MEALQLTAISKTMEGVLNYGVFALYILAMAGIAVYTVRKNKTVNDFLLAGRGMGGWMTAFAYGTTYFSTVIFVGYAGTLGRTYGLAATWVGIGNAIVGSLVPWLILAKRSRKMTGVSHVKTMPEFFEARFDSKWVKLVSAILIFVMLIPYSASVYSGLGYVFEMFFGMELWEIIIILAAVTALYVTFGGYRATVLSDFFQGIIMIAGVFIMFFCIYNYESVNNIADSMGQKFSQLVEDGFGFVPRGGANSVYNLIMLVLLTSLGTWAVPQIVTKFAAVKDEKAIRRATGVSTGICLIIGVGAYVIGCAARYIVDGYGGMYGDMIIPELFFKALPAGLYGLIAVLLLSASMSTLSSLALCASSAVAVDLYKGYIVKKASDRHIKTLLNILCAVFIGISAIIAILRPTGIIELMSLSWGTLAGCFIGPFVLGLFSKRITKAAVFASIGTGAGLTAILYTISLTVSAASPWLAAPAIGVICMAASFIVTIAVSLFTKAPGEATLKVFFDALDKPIE